MLHTRYIFFENNVNSKQTVVRRRIYELNDYTKMTGRSLGEVWKTVWQNFKQSFNKVNINETYVGKDQYGNKYFERVAGKTICI